MTVAGTVGAWLGQAFVIGLGWWVVHRLSAARDRDKARREMVAKSVDGLADGLSGVLTDARDYHISVREVSRELKIKMTLQDLAMRVAGLAEVCADEAFLAPCRADIAALRRAITGEHFEDEHLGPLPDAARQLQSIAEAILRAKRSFLRLKHRQFPLA